MGMIDNTKTKWQKSHINKIALNNSVQKLKEQISTGKIKYNISSAKFIFSPNVIGKWWSIFFFSIFDTFREVHVR